MNFIQVFTFTTIKKIYLFFIEVSVNSLNSYPNLIKIPQEKRYEPEILQKQYSDLIESLTGESDVECIDIRSALNKRLSRVIADDGIHPNDEGHKIIAQEICKVLMSFDAKIGSWNEEIFNKFLGSEEG